VIVTFATFAAVDVLEFALPPLLEQEVSTVTRASVVAVPRAERASGGIDELQAGQ